jgi:signal transduction histidine kinase
VGSTAENLPRRRIAGRGVYLIETARDATIVARSPASGDTLGMVTSPEAFAAEADPRLRAALGWFPANAHRAAVLALPPVAASSLLLGARSNHLAYPRGAVIYATYLIVAPVLVGLMWLRRRPASRLGPLLVALGFLAWPISWQGSDAAVLYSLGVLGAAPPIAMSLYLCLAFSTGRIRTAFESYLLVTLIAMLALFFGASLLFSPTLLGEGPLLACAAACPENPFHIGSQPEFLNWVARLVTYVGLAVVAGIAAVWIRRFRAATRPQRRTLVPVALSSLLLVPTLFVVYFSVLVLGVGGGTAETLSWLLVGMWIVFPLGFAVALLQADLFAGRAFRQLLSELASRPTPERWRDIVAGALGDPSLRLGYWDPRSGRFRDAAGLARARPPERARRLWTEVHRDGLRVAALDTDEALAENPELVDAAASATLLAVETGRLEGELRASQARALAAAAAERRRIGRDLHDSAQQRLVALRVHLSLAGEQLQPEEQPLVEQLERELDEALDELQSVARGIYPHVLAEHGVAAALRSAVRSAAIPVTITDDTRRRHSEAIELAVYFSCLEALQNAAKHAGRGTSVGIWLSDGDDGLRFRVEDDGRGFEPGLTDPGAGLSNLADRLAAVGGSIRIDSAPGRGTRIAGHVPV